jgi:predicted CXXCH cytochrome family protein
MATDMKVKLGLLLVLLLAMTKGNDAQTLSSSKHNLSVTGTGTIKASNENEVCIFCHAPHHARTTGPLWNKADPGVTYTIYNSSTTNALIGQPDGASVMCLSCHDGTIALGSIVSAAAPISFGGYTNMPMGATNLGTNLSDDHPISFVYNTSLVTANGQLAAPAAITAPVSLDRDNKMQCTSCHEAHDNSNSNFLVATTQGSALCYSCHNKTYWGSSTHYSSTKTWNGLGTNPWFHTPYSTVADNACENCHNPHSAGTPVRLLNFANEEDNCLNCHNGNAASKNVQAQFTKTYKHNVYGYAGIHDESEAAIMGTKHVECEDCHNPHAVNATSASAPNVKGFNIGAKGVDANGSAVNPAIYEYQICFRCHSDNPAIQPYTQRYRGVGNMRNNFNTTNVSYHPVEAAGKNLTMTSLIGAYTVSSKIYCSDCHGSDGSGAPSGPHGSNNIAILKYAYDTTRFPMLGTGWSAVDLYSHWTLCFQCHNLSSVTTIHTSISSGHYFKYIGCNTCHDPHGYDGSLGTNGGSTASAFERLVNFDTSVIRPNLTNGKLIDIPNRKCYMVCHQNASGTSGVYHEHLNTGSPF